MKVVSPLNFPRIGGGGAPLVPIAYIDSVFANDTGGGSDDPITAGIDTSGATLLVAVVATINNAVYVMSDSKGNVWSSAVFNSNNCRAQIYYAENPTVGAGHTFQATGNSGFVSVCVAAFSGVNAVAPLDQVNDDPTATPGSITPVEDNELVIAAVAATGGVGGITGGFTEAEFTGAAPLRGGLAYLIQGPTAPANPTWSGVGGTISSAIASFKHE